jgi:hypothetical protein
VLDGQLIRLNPNPQLGAKVAVLYTAWMLVGFNRVHPMGSRHYGSNVAGAAQIVHWFLGLTLVRGQNGA